MGHKGFEREIPKTNYSTKKLKKMRITFSVATACKLVNFPGGEKKFFEWLRKNKYLQSNNEPYQKYVDRDWLTSELTTINGIRLPTPVPRFTMAGIVAFEKIVLKAFPPCIPCDKNAKTNI
jgi:phage antirepressor YoqD-like protein